MKRHFTPSKPVQTRFLPLLLALLTLFFPCFTRVNAAEPTLDTRFPVVNVWEANAMGGLDTDAWYYPSMRLCYETGLMTGTDQGAEPTRILTQSEAVALAGRVAATLRNENISDPKAGENWWEPYNSYLLEHNLAEGISAPSSPATRQQFLELLYLSSTGLFTEVNQISLLPDTTDEKVLAFYNSGILTGKDAYGTFDGAASLSRAEAAAMLARLIDPAQRLKFTPEVQDSSETAENKNDFSDYQSELNSTAALYVNGEAISLQTYVATLNTLADRFCSYYNLDNSKLFSGVYGSSAELAEMFQEAAEEQLLQNFFAEKLSAYLGCTTAELAEKVAGNASEEVLAAFAEESHYYRAFHILVLSEGRTDAQAKALAEEIIAQLNASPSTTTFFALLNAYNEDPGMTSNPYGYLFTDGEMVEEFENAVKALGEYEYTLSPVQTSYGYHVILRLPAQSHPELTGLYQDSVLTEVLNQNIAAATITKNEVMLDKLDVAASYQSYLSKKS